MGERGSILLQLVFAMLFLSMLMLYIFPYVMSWHHQLQEMEIHHYLQRDAVYLSWYLGELIRRADSVSLITNGFQVCESEERCVQVERYTNHYGGSGLLKMLRKRINWQGHSVLSYYTSNMHVSIEGELVQIHLLLERGGVTVSHYFTVELRKVKGEMAKY
ncbi:hypothetical protein [Rubeoparvulum massiliense]|uniref:hypothetical protein n=1 Tax=Rubeoparvulum massiliense TaxID=1631346 RepID=UPI0011C9097C|nr:hypothetical protein [Rubeoparvulum massiliense]